MAPQLEVAWSGAKERAGEAAGLSSPFIGSSARLCMELGSNANKEGPLQPVYVRRKTTRCQRCSIKFTRTASERLCARCFVASHRPVWS